ncbi:PH domain-containing protein [Streptomyces sp. NPDC014801]|uniref:PH domain-containing protein n=1 Tax=Streptomyces sp. NPDC014801 TaxID=3364916 RepID=UPI0036F5FE46
MTTPEHPSPAPQPQDPAVQDRVHRSSAGIASGVMLLALAGWLGIDAIVVGHGRTPWLALAGLLLVVPLVVAYTLRPAIFVNDDRLRVRNPLRVIVLPWGTVGDLRSGYSNEVVTVSGARYQLWALPVSLRARKRAARQRARAAAAGGAERGGLLGAPERGGASGEPPRAQTDKAMDDLKQLREDRCTADSAQGEVTVRWAYEIIAPALAGAILTAILAALG